MDGINTAFESEAVSRATLMMLPGLDGTDVFYRPLIELLSDRIDPVPISFPNEGPYDYVELSKWVRQRVAEVPSFYVMATSFSGPLAALLAAAEPERVRGIIFVASFLRTPRRYPAVYRLLATTPTVKILRIVRRIPIWLLGRRTAALRAAKSETFVRASARSLAFRARELLSVDAREALCQYRNPVISVSYASDRTVPHRYAEEIHLHCGSATSVQLAGGHCDMFTHPSDLANVILRFTYGHGPLQHAPYADEEARR